MTVGHIIERLDLLTWSRYWANGDGREAAPRIELHERYYSSTVWGWAYLV